MALLTRPTQTKVFGSTALAAELTVFGTATVSTDINLILNSTEAQRGWGTVGANDFPPLEWFNALGYGLSYQTAYLFQQGIPQWTALQEFYINSYAVGSDGKLYRSKTGVSGTPNSGNNPTTDTTNVNWIESIKADMPAVINAAVAKTTPVDADLIGLVDSADSFSLKKTTWANVKTALTGLFAPIASPAFTGTPTAPTALVGDSSTQIANTAFVQSATTSSTIQLGTGVTASGTAVNFIGIPANVKRINIMFDGVSTSGTSNPIIRIGTGGAVSVTGYTATGEQQTAQALYTNGFGIPYGAGTNVYRASFVLTRMSGNTWIMSGQIVTTNAASTGRVIGSITLAGELDIVSATTVNGTDTFDAGSINISWEF